MSCCCVDCGNFAFNPPRCIPCERVDTRNAARHARDAMIAKVHANCDELDARRQVAAGVFPEFDATPEQVDLAPLPVASDGEHPDSWRTLL